MSVDVLQYVGSKRKVRVQRRTPCDPLLNGYLLGSSKSLLLMHVFHDFMPDGYLVFRLEDVEEIRSGPYERHWDEMLEAEGLLDGLDLPVKVDLTTFRAAIESISERFRYFMIQSEDPDEPVQDTYVGSFVSATPDSVAFRIFDGRGYWDEEPVEIDVAEITKVHFDAPYINTFSRHLRSGPRPVSLTERSLGSVQ
tara:strand:- start:22 stop:609 length:588 start_codon:yes stop_codon:yes gene_type:complete